MVSAELVGATQFTAKKRIRHGTTGLGLWIPPKTIPNTLKESEGSI